MMAHNMVKIRLFGGPAACIFRLKEVDLPITSKTTVLLTLVAVRKPYLANRSYLTRNRFHPHSNRSPWYRHDALTPAHSYKHDRLARVTLNWYKSVGGLLLLLKFLTKGHWQAV